jgi:alkanesulfonate monooxygenase SsuD/methylene tetrahydromethanopterin reductase-like flavin-dependent oxidoreductase (luciferase family)
MEIEVGLDAGGLSYEDESQITVDAARLGYRRIWTGSGGDPFQTCALRWAAARAVVSTGIGTAIGVMPVGVRTPADLAVSTAALSRLTEGRFILGIGAGSVYQPTYRRSWGIEERSSLALVRAYLTTIRGFLAGETVTYNLSGLKYRDARLPAEPTPTQLYMGIAGPEMARLGGELADGLYLSWCTAENVRWTRDHIAEGAARTRRDLAEIELVASVRVSIDEDVRAARHSVARALLPYVFRLGGALPTAFRANFQRMGFGPEIAELDGMRERGTPRQEIIEAFPERMLRELSYFGSADGAAEGIRRLAGDADIAVVRMVPAGTGGEPMRAILRACRPGAAAG